LTANIGQQADALISYSHQQRCLTMSNIMAILELQDAGGSALKEAASAEFVPVPDNTCSNELALLVED